MFKFLIAIGLICEIAGFCLFIFQKKKTAKMETIIMLLATVPVAMVLVCSLFYFFYKIGY